MIPVETKTLRKQVIKRAKKNKKQNRDLRQETWVIVLADV